MIPETRAKGGREKPARSGRENGDPASSVPNADCQVRGRVETLDPKVVLRVVGSRFRVQRLKQDVLCLFAALQKLSKLERAESEVLRGRAGRLLRKGECRDHHDKR